MGYGGGGGYGGGAGGGGVGCGGIKISVDAALFGGFPDRIRIRAV